jgi:DNA-binding transcriptional regulator YiaG
MTIADINPRRIREQLGLTQAEFARVLGLAGDRQVRAWEAPAGSPTHRGISGPTAVLLRALITLPALRRHLGLPSALVD